MILGLIILSVVIFAALRGSYQVALTALAAAAGFYAGKLIAEASESKATLKTLIVGAFFLAAGIVAGRVLGLLPEIELRGFGLWTPLAALFGASILGLGSGVERKGNAQKFRAILELYPHPDGGQWTAEGMERATNGEAPSPYFEDLLAGRIQLGSMEAEVAMARAMDFPSELWNRKPEWWQETLDRKRRGEDVGDRLQEWDCYTPEVAAKLLGVSREEIMTMVRERELEGRRGADGYWQIRAAGVDHIDFANHGTEAWALPRYNRMPDTDRAGSGRYISG